MERGARLAGAGRGALRPGATRASSRAPSATFDAATAAQPRHRAGRSTARCSTGRAGETRARAGGCVDDVVRRGARQPARVGGAGAAGARATIRPRVRRASPRGARLDPVNARRAVALRDRRRARRRARSPAATTAGSCQSQSIEACRNQASSAAHEPAAAAGVAPQRAARGRDDAGDHQREREQADEPQLRGHLELERVRVAHGLGDRALAQPVDAEAARAEAGRAAGARTRRSPTRQYS